MLDFSDDVLEDLSGFSGVEDLVERHIRRNFHLLILKLHLFPKERFILLLQRLHCFLRVEGFKIETSILNLNIVDDLIVDLEIRIVTHSGIDIFPLSLLLLFEDSLKFILEPVHHNIKYKYQVRLLYDPIIQSLDY